jgi:hypothetical protein
VRCAHHSATGFSIAFHRICLADARERAKTILLEIGAGKDPNAGSARQYVQRRSTHRVARRS